MSEMRMPKKYRPETKEPASRPIDRSAGRLVDSNRPDTNDHHAPRLTISSSSHCRRRVAVLVYFLLHAFYESYKCILIDVRIYEMRFCGRLFLGSAGRGRDHANRIFHCRTVCVFSVGIEAILCSREFHLLTK